MTTCVETCGTSMEAYSCIGYVFLALIPLFFVTFISGYFCIFFKKVMAHFVTEKGFLICILQLFSK